MVKATIERFGKIDIIYNCAGILMKSAPIETIEESLWNRMFEVNVKSVFLTAKYVVPEMKVAGGGVIINIASLVAVKALKHFSPYASSKGAVITLTKALALELATHNIRVNCINPALTDTPMLEVYTEEQKEAMVSTFPLGRIIEPEDIAHAALYLASDESSMLTGSCLNVDGGRAI
ncbi:SDR family NAD(P)-dependent oxidoreductase, partial [Chloroflexota bacterium]